MFKPLLASGLLLLILAACGGGGGNGYEEAVAQADAKEAQARSLAAESPCTSVDQCANLSFRSPTAACSTYTFKPYSLVSASAAAASAAAAEQRELADKAFLLGPHAGVACVAIVGTPPQLACRASTCQVL